MLAGETVLSGAEVDNHVSGYEVLLSGAGYFIGTQYTYCDAEHCNRCDDGGHRMPAGSVVPYTRETGYFTYEKDAAAALQGFIDTGELEKRRT